MPNTLLTPDIIAREALLVLENNLVMANLVHRDYSAEFAQVGDTITIRKPATFVSYDFTDAITVQDTTEGSTTVKLDRHRDVSFAVTSKELSLDIQDFSEQLIQPAMRAQAQAIDQDILNEAANIPASVQAAASPTNLADIAALSKTLDLAKAPLDMRRLVLHPTHKYRYALTDNLSKVAYAGNGQTLRNAELGRIYSLDTYMDQNAPDTLASAAGTATGYTVTGAKGARKVALSSLSGAAVTVKTGDGFILDGRLYRFTADGTGVSGAMAEISIDMPLLADYTAAAVYVVRATHSLAFHRNAIALVTRPLSLPLGAAKAATINDRGMGVRVVYQYDTTTKKDTISLDILYGIKTLDANLAVKLVG
ncbi:MAG: P22 phage major capsid protein family protein [Bacillota bacterium]|nr:P22 phage major capsid protein family protein [Bacillota bacterium]